MNIPHVAGRFLFVLSGIVLLTSLSMAQTDAPETRGQRVFVCGHSFHMPVANLLPEIVKSAGIDQPPVSQQRINGSTVLQHWELADDRNTLKQALRAGEIDVLTLSPTARLPDEGIDKFTALALEHNPRIRILVQASWASFDSPTANPRTFKNEQRDAAQPEALRQAYEPFYQLMTEQVQRLNEQHQAAPDRPIVGIVPVAQAVIRLREQVAEGMVPGISKQSELFRDDRGHGTPTIYLLATYCNYAVIYGRSPVGLPVPTPLKARFPGNEEQINRSLQEIAWDTVTSHPLTGVKK